MGNSGMTDGLEQWRCLECEAKDAEIERLKGVVQHGEAALTAAAALGHSEYSSQSPVVFLVTEIERLREELDEMEAQNRDLQDEIEWLWEEWREQANSQWETTNIRIKEIERLKEERHDREQAARWLKAWVDESQWTHFDDEDIVRLADWPWLKERSDG